MLLNSGFQQAPTWPQHQALPYNTVESLLEDVSKQMSSSSLMRRHSRGTTAQRSTGGSMRVVKPNSTSNSPRESSTLGRRKTIVGSGANRSRPLNMESNNGSVGGMSMCGLKVPTRSNRPVSWHPSTRVSSQNIFQYSPPAMAYNTEYGAYEMPMTPAVYSGYTSPASTFSPVSLPYTGYDQYPFPEDNTYFPSLDQNNNVYTPYQPSTLRQQENMLQAYQNTEAEDLTMYTHFDWTNFVTNGFNNTTAPPTPDNFLSLQQPERSFQAEEAIPYQSLDDEEAGEELVALGLYDAPEKPAPSDHLLDNYRITMMQQVPNSSYPSGKGLKLEETWVPPPPADDEDEEDEDDEEDNDARGSPTAEESVIVEEDSILAKFAGSSF